MKMATVALSIYFSSLWAILLLGLQPHNIESLAIGVPYLFLPCHIHDGKISDFIFVGNTIFVPGRLIFQVKDLITLIYMVARSDNHILKKIYSKSNSVTLV